MIDEEKLTCPICGNEYNNLLSHIRRSHDNSIKDRGSFEDRFPELAGCKLQKTTIFDMSKSIFCPICGKEYHRNNDVQNHIRCNHPDNYTKYTKRKQPTLTCPICNEQRGNLRQHIRETHELNWEDFCKKYNWNVKDAKVITDEYRKKLSDNKKKYYNSERGQHRKELQSNRWKTNNPSHNPEYLSKSIWNRTHNGNLKCLLQDMRGIKIQCMDKTFRSFNEFKFFILCKHYGFSIDFEPKEYCVKWLNKEKNWYSTYLPDFYIDGIGLIELKNSKSTINKCITDQKYVSVKKIYDELNIPYNIIYIKEFFKQHNIKLDFKDKQFVKHTVLDLYKNDKIHIITPYRHSSELQYIFDTKDLSTIKCIEFTKKTGHNLYGEL